MRTHKIVTYTYEFLRLWILKKYYDSLKENETKITIPIITVETIKAAFKTFIKEKEIKSESEEEINSENKTEKDKNMQYEKIRLCNEFHKFYNDECKDLQFGDKVDGTYLTQILRYMATDMLTNIENNVKLHFVKYIKRFVNSCFKKKNAELLEKCDKGTKTITRNLLNKQMYEVKEDLLNNTLISDPQYHQWIDKHKKFIFPSVYNNINECEYDMINHPQIQNLLSV